MPGRYLRSSHGWLKNVAFIVPVSSATVASTSGRIPRRRTGRLVIERTSTTTVAVSPGSQLEQRAGVLAVARQVLEQGADGVQAEALGAGRGLGGLDVERVRERATAAGSAAGRALGAPRRSRGSDVVNAVGRTRQLWASGGRHRTPAG